MKHLYFLLTGVFCLFLSDVSGQCVDGCLKVNVGVIVDTLADPCDGPLTLDAHNPGATYLWSTGETTRTIEVTETDTFWVEVTDASGCSGTDTIDVTYTGTPTVDLGPDPEPQCGGCVSLDAGPDDGNYLWSTGETTSSIDYCSPGVNEVWVRSGTYGCYDYDTVTVTITPGPVVDLGPDITQCEGTVTLDAGIDTEGAATYEWSTGETSQTITVTETDTVSVEVTDAEGCIGMDTVAVNIGEPVSVELEEPATQCGGCVSLDAGDEGTSYQWSTGDTTQTISYCQTGTNEVSVRVENYGCFDTDEVTVEITPGPEVDLGTDTTICTVTDLELDAGNAGASYEWSTGETSQTITVSSSGTYYVEVTEAEGCVGQDSIEVTYSTPPVVRLGPERPEQCGGCVSLDAGNPGASYLWSTGATSRTIEYCEPGLNNEVWVEVTNAAGCTAADTVITNIQPGFEVNLGPDITQCGGSVTLEADEGEDYEWSTGGTGQSITVSQTDTVMVEVTNSEGCTGMDTVIVRIGEEPEIDLGPDPAPQCGGCVSLDAGAGYDSYLWSTGQTSRFISYCETGNNDVWVRVENFGCYASDTVTTDIDEGLEVDLGPDIEQCGGTVTLNAGPGQSYEWSTGETDQMIEVSSTDTFFVDVVGENGCSGADTIVVMIGQTPEIALADDTSQCGGCITLDAGVDNSSYEWSTGETSRTIRYCETGTNTVSVNVNNYSCEATDEIDVTIEGGLTVDLGTDTTICDGSPLELDAGNPGASYDWSTGETSQRVVINSSGTYSVQLEEDECFGEDEIEVTYSSPPSVRLGPERPEQCGGCVSLDAGNPGATYLWSTGETTREIDYCQTGLDNRAWVEVTNNAGCTATDTVITNITPGIDVDLGQDQVICAGESIMLDAGNASEYNWNTGATSSEITVSTSGVYSVEVESDNDCEGYDSVTVTVREPVQQPDTIYEDAGPCTEQTYSIDPVAGINSYSWEVPGDWTIISGQGTTEIVVEPGTTNGPITVSSVSDGCFSEAATIMNPVVTPPAELFIPNAFTPNGDDYNDEFVITNLDKFPDNELTVINRWGNVVFEESSYNNNWDGGSLREGTYFYTLEVEICDEAREFKGDLTIIR